MRLANLNGRLVVVNGEGHYVDVERASDGRFSHKPQAMFERWAELTAWASGIDSYSDEPVEHRHLRAPVPQPRQIFAVGLNYRDHASESGFAVPEQPTVFTKFASCLTGPETDIALPPAGNTDWEVELVAVIGTEATGVEAASAWAHVAGLMVGQDISERITQAAGPAPQFSLGKSFANFGPTGPWLVTTDEFANPDDLELGCSINGEEMQKGRTRDLVFTVPDLISKLSAVVTLYPGDLIFTGTPAGVGLGRRPQVWLQPGDNLVSWVEGIGEIRQHFVASAD